MVLYPTIKTVILMKVYCTSHKPFVRVRFVRRGMDWKKVTEVAELTSHDISATEEIVPRAQGMDIVTW